MPINEDDTRTPEGSRSRLSSDLAPSAPPFPTVEVRVTRSIAEVDAIREIWSAWKTHRDSDIDFCMDFVWRSDDFLRPHVILLYRIGIPDAMLVGRLERRRLDLRIGYLPLRSMPIRVLSFSFDGFLGRQTEENAEALVKSVMDALRRGEADAAYFQLRTDGPLFRKASAMPGFTSRDRFVRSCNYRVMAILGTAEQVYAGLSPGLRADLRRKRRKLLRDFGDSAKISCVRTTAELANFMPRAEEIARETYQRGLGVGFEDSELMRRRLRLCAERGWLRAYLLTIDERPRAFWIGTLYEGVFCSDYLGFDPEFASYSPGTVLFGEMLEDFYRSGVREVHFGVGDGRYKERFGKLRFEVADPYIFATGPRGAALNAAKTATGMLHTAARRALGSAGALSRVRNAWRSKLSGGGRS